MSYWTEKRSWWGWGRTDAARPEAKGFMAYLAGHIKPWPDWTWPEPNLDAVALRPSRLPVGLETDLAGLVGAEFVRTDPEERVRHGLGRGYRDLIRLRLGTLPAPPDAVVYPANHDQVVALLNLAMRYHAAVVPYGGGSSVVGGLELDAKIRPVLCLDLTRMNRVLSLDPISLTARIEAGIMGPDLEEHLGRAGYTLGHFPQSFEFSTLGGWIAARGAGHKSLRYGKIEDLVVALRLARPGGESLTPRVPAHAAGGDLPGLFIGSEGTLGIITEAETRISPKAESTWFGSWLFPDFLSGISATREMLAQGYRPATIRLSDQAETAALMGEAAAHKTGWGARLVMETLAPRYLALRGVDLARACLLLIVGEGHKALVGPEQRGVTSICRRHGGVKAGTGPARTWDRTRYTTPYLRDLMIGQGLLVETLETATTWERLPALADLVREALRASLENSGAQAMVMTHLSHAYQDGANLYFTFVAPQERGREEEQWSRAKTAATEAIIEAGAALSHHHGVGRDHRPWMERYWGADLIRVHQAAKASLDPTGLLNPGILFDPEPPQGPRPFSPATRATNLARFARQTFDLLVVGGGIVGAGVAWDASLRGLSVALVEKLDFGSGTSGKSSRMIHGGLRYLKMLDLKLVRESLNERHHLLRMAPDLVKPMRHLVPVYKGEKESRMLLHLGLWGYDHLAGGKGLPPHETLSVEEVVKLEPQLNREGLQGGLVYYDALTDDARLTLETIKAAARAGAAPANHVELTGIEVDSDQVRATVVDRIDGGSFAIMARCLVNAAGVWSDRVRAAADPRTPARLRPSKGIHITFPRSLWPIKHVVILKGSDGRPLFAVPSGQVVYVGTTDTTHDGDLDEPHADRAEVGYLLQAVNAAMTGPALTMDQITASWAGIRPLVADPGREQTKDISREHEITVESGRLISVCGGKLTTFRIMAAQTVDRVCDLLGLGTGTGTLTADMPLYSPSSGIDDSGTSVEPAVEDRMREKYGSEAQTLAGLTSYPRLAAVLDEDLGLTAAEIYWAVQGEMALTLTDVMVRRLRLTYMTTDNGWAVAGLVAREMAWLLSWSPEETRRQLDLYRAFLDAELAFRAR